jgi:SAM-dependent methyltransferase
MGISRAELYHLALIADRYHPRDIRNVCDLGQQDFYPENASPIDRFAELMGVDQAAILGCKTSAEIWRACGRRCVSLDMVGTDFVRFNLNTDTVSAKLASKFDLVTNFGTTEHVANQLNAFRAIHDLTAPTGIMFHVVPAAGFSNHGFFNYNMRFFFCLAKANNYDVIDAYMPVDTVSGDRLNQDVIDFCASFDRGPDNFDRPSLAAKFSSRHAGISIILRRPAEKQAFRTPMDLDGIQQAGPDASNEARRSLWRRLRAKA